jgi:hypothetical protein
MNAITNFYDSASGRITDPIAFLAADAAIKKQVIRCGPRTMRATPRPSATRSMRS